MEKRRICGWRASVLCCARRPQGAAAPQGGRGRWRPRPAQSGPLGRACREICPPFGEGRPHASLVVGGRAIPAC